MNSQILSADLKPSISARALKKSGRVLKAVSLLYLPFHGLKPGDLFEFYGPIAFVSSAIYQADELNEHDNGISAPSLKTVREYLEHTGLLDERTLRYLQDGEQYLAYERRFRKTRPLDLDEVITAMRWRSSDFRILHCVLHRLIGKPYAPATFHAYEAFEMLMEVDDDIGSYNEDSEAGTFNFLRALSLLPSSDPKETAEGFRRDTIRRIEEFRRLLPDVLSETFAEIVRTYSDIVPEPVIPKLNGFRYSAVSL